MSLLELCTTAEPSAMSNTLALDAVRLAGYTALAMPSPTSRRPSRMDPGWGVRRDQPMRAAPSA